MMNVDAGLGQIDLVGAEQIEHVELALRRRRNHARRVEAPRLWHEAEVEPGDARSGRVQHVEGVPARVLAVPAALRNARSKAEDGGAVGARGRAGADDHHGVVRRLQDLGEGVLALGDVGERLRAGSEILVRVGETPALADDADLEAALAPALQDARVQHGRLDPRVGADEQDRVGAVDAGDA